MHGNYKPFGPNWEKLRQFGGPRVKFLHRDLPETIFGNQVKSRSHISDVWRVAILLEYGGIYCDWDLIWLKPLDDLLEYDAVASVDILDWSPYPDVLNLGAFMAKRGATFLKYLTKAMQFYEERGHTRIFHYYNACLVPYKVYECHPNTLKVEKSFQVICSNDRCHPSWQEGYKNLEKVSGFENAEALFKNAFSVHYTAPELKEFESMETLLANPKASFMTEIAMRILKQSGLVNE